MEFNPQADPLNISLQSSDVGCGRGGWPCPVCRLGQHLGVRGSISETSTPSRSSSRPPHETLGHALDGARRHLRPQPPLRLSEWARGRFLEVTALADAGCLRTATYMAVAGPLPVALPGRPA